MGIIQPLIRFFAGRPFALPETVIRTHPELSTANFRIGGLPPRIAGWALGQSSVAAITLGNTVFIASRTVIDAGLLLHELRHVQQFRESKTFLIRYLWESIRRGYAANLYEAEARRFSVEQLARAREITTDKGGPKWSSTPRHRS